MRAGREGSDYLADIFDAAGQALAFVEGLDYEAFLQDRKTQFAVVRALEIIGEAAGKVPDAERQLLPHVPWRLMAAMRNKLIHEYFGVDPEVVWKTTQEDLPGLIRILEGTGLDPVSDLG